MTLGRGSRDDTTARSPVSARFVLSFSSPAASLSPRSLTLRAFSISSFFFSIVPLPLRLLPSLLSSKRRQVGIRAAVNSPAPLSALMSLLLFALLNAIRAYSVSLPPLPQAPRSPHRPFDFLDTRSGGSRERIYAHARVRARASSRSSTWLSRSRTPRQVHDTRAHANARYRAEGTAGP